MELLSTDGHTKHLCTRSPALLRLQISTASLFSDASPSSLPSVLLRRALQIDGDRGDDVLTNQIFFLTFKIPVVPSSARSPSPTSLSTQRPPTSLLPSSRVRPHSRTEGEEIAFFVSTLFPDHPLLLCGPPSRLLLLRTALCLRYWKSSDSLALKPPTFGRATHCSG